MLVKSYNFKSDCDISIAWNDRVTWQPAETQNTWDIMIVIDAIYQAEQLKYDAYHLYFNGM